ncbi:MAG TPA: hypothetical protein VG389_18470 [Myxococcota bacterium]|nr:hypothetical protein [Myxococcota bacterium]
MAKRRVGAVEPSKVMRELVETVRREVKARLGPGATFEQRRDASAALMAEALATMVDEDEEEDQAGGHRQRR